MAEPMSDDDRAGLMDALLSAAAIRAISRTKLMQVHRSDHVNDKPRQMPPGSHSRTSAGIKNARSRSHPIKPCAMPAIV
jgi:hypothetical protein